MLDNGLLKGRLMNGVKIKRDELLGVLRTNLSKHKEDVKEALELRRVEMRAFFDNEIQKLDNNSAYQPKQTHSFPIPEDMSSEYEKVIRMVEMTEDEVIPLSEDQFDKLVMDNWSWKDNLVATSALYGKSI